MEGDLIVQWSCSAWRRRKGGRLAPFWFGGRMAVRITNGPVAVSMCRFTRSHASVARPRAGAGSP